jgi:hypothetical protein
MASPSSAITRTELGTTFEEFDLMMNKMNFIGSSVLRPRSVGKNAADVGKIKIEQLLQSHSTQRNPGAGYKRDSFTFDKFSYSVLEYGKEEVIDDAQLAMYGDIVDAEDVSARRAEHAVLEEYERDVAAAVFNATTFAGAMTGAVAVPWSTAATATPTANIATAIEAVAANSGLEANALVINRKTLRNLMNTAELVDRIKYTQTPTASQIRSAMADLFDLKYILVAGGFKNTANSGQDASISRIWSDSYAMVCRVAETDDPRESCLGRTFIWPGDGPSAPGDGGALAVLMEEYREEKVRGSVMRARNNRDIVIMYAEAGYLLSGI